MRETLKYYYDIYPSITYEINYGYFFFINDIKYYFVKFNRNINELDLLIDITNNLYKRNVLVNTFVKNKYNSFYVNFDDFNYVLLRVNSIENDIYDLKDIIYFNNLLIVNNNYKLELSWADLWKKKIDNFEQEISEYNTEYPIIREYFDYYIGLAENALSYFNDTLIEEDMNSVKICLSHKRIINKPSSGFINNPLNFTFDYEVRDASEYIKSKFFNDELNYDEIYELICSKFNKASLRLLFARLLYPSYFFDMVKKIIIEDEEEKKIEKYVNKIEDYEIFLADILSFINRKFNIPQVEWLMNIKE